MSFILDALKKSESDRQRHSGPALFEVRVAPPRTGLPLWAIAVAALLLVNLAIVMWMLWRHPAARTADTSTAAAAVPGPAPPAPASAAAATTPAPPSVPPRAPAPNPGAANGAGDNPEDYAPAAEPAAAPPPGNHVRQATADGVPLYQEAAAAPGKRIPQLRLDLHVFALRPQDRFVMINMHKLREGDSLAEGVRVDSITPEGAVLSYGGSRFLLPRD